MIAPDAPVDKVILPPLRDLGDGFSVRRALPSPGRRMVGPFIFFDEMGPAVLTGEHALDVRPHPHIGLATVTYLIEGEILHRDSLGSLQPIRPGEVNWMTAGSGIVHSERTPVEARGKDALLHGLQIWVALPTQHEEAAPTFRHYGAGAIPVGEEAGARITLISGEADGLKSPVETFSDMIYADLVLAPGARYAFSAEHVERAVYVVSGTLRVAGQDGQFEQGQLVLLKPGTQVVLSSEQGARLMLVGGEPLPEKRYIYWNFVSSRPDRIEQAKDDWRNDRFARVPGEHEFIPLPAEVPGAKLV
ncbi:pirin family protein [Novosphingobium nitrogenifigens DSM 19370]|uniref:Pirin family protein n=1 Tax=Novosphingobium nitrogenifigens DSM 19370 TaxID=983920 RepID=F1ZCN0_9SPHN|nr:pirin family protein [Novosphingobium nitrogenifigens]EGD57633.1 pirin family protein [Novosphingobium nitrogenifigens DSM 19370]